MSKNKENKFFKIISNILFAMVMMVIVSLIFITAQSKLTGREPTILNHRIYIVDSGSMSPAIEVDSMIIVKELSFNEINIGDIITYYGHDRESRVTHRVVNKDINNKMFITKGDANNTTDPMPLDSEKLIGRVSIIIPLIGKVFRFLNTRLGMGILITAIIFWIIVPVIGKRFRRSKKIDM